MNHQSILKRSSSNKQVFFDYVYHRPLIKRGVGLDSEWDGFVEELLLSSTFFK
jgi:hypothetical protein